MIHLRLISPPDLTDDIVRQMLSLERPPGASIS